MSFQQGDGLMNPLPKTVLCLAIVTALCLVGPDATQAREPTVWYVSTTGSDNNSGISLETPFATLNRALETARPGDTIRIRPGTYAEALVLEKLGQDHGEPIVIEGQPGLDPPVFDGQGVHAIGLWCEDCANLTIRHLVFTGYTDLAVGFTQSTRITLENISARDNGCCVQLTDWEFEGYGLFLENSTDCLVKDCETSGNGPKPQGELLMGTGINMYGCADSRILDNVSHHNIGGGILVEDSFNILVQGNTVYANDLDASIDGWWDGGLWLDGGGNVVVRDNLFYSNLGPGLEISNEDNQNIQGYVVEGNVCHSNYWGVYI
ncbi:MAG: DUF1565 domain-containing protein [Desulfovibrio sp.]|nr:MAG: DUF1565 domain-containing protein [Desulfovibrio sp.]